MRYSLLSIFNMVIGLTSTLVFLPVSTIAIEFQGTLKSISITDTLGSNTPPVANFTYSSEGNTITFNASDSFDPDGNITQYKWDFGDGTTSEGKVVYYEPASDAPFSTTLTVIDDNGGITLFQQMVGSQASMSLPDQFDADSSANYKALIGGIKVENGEAYGTQNWQFNIVYHQSSTGSNNHYAEADCEFSGIDYTGLILRHNGTTGYVVGLNPKGLNLYTLNNSSLSWAGTFSNTLTLTAEKKYKIKTTVEGTTFQAFIDLNNDGDYFDAGEELKQVNHSAYTQGQFIGLIFKYGAGNNSLALDNFAGAAL